MSNLHTFRTETKVGNLEFIGTIVAENFDYKTFALDNGFFNTSVDSIHNTEKYGGVGFFVAKNFSDSSETSYHLKKRLEVLFVNGLPVIYKIA
tara:strand:- start:238 stop:516 length:279 start_codon:yes stop_codon:yes gene_type:complete